MIPAIVVFLSALLCYGLGFVVHELLLRWNVVDRPNHRSSHSEPTVRGGGIGIIITLIVSGVLLGIRLHSLTLLILLGSGLLLSIVSFVDDLRPLRPLYRFGCHA